MSYAETLKWLFSLERFGVKLGLKNISTLLQLLDNPQKKFFSIHITGTNGKGSVSAYIANILSSAGLKVGLYTSPHVSDFTERIIINNKKISPKIVVQLVNNIKPMVSKTARITGASPTFFEVTTALAFSYFAERNIDCAVIEVGLGGRLDATNVIDNTPVAVITNVSKEHTQYLGNHLSQIAYEKAGIIKDSTKFVVTGAKGFALDTIKKICKKYKQAKLIVLDRDIYYKEQKLSFTSPPPKAYYKGQTPITVYGWLNSYPDIVVPLLGKYQLSNATLAVGAIEALSAAELNFTFTNISRSIREGIAKTSLPARLEVVHSAPIVVLDCAHNPAAIKNLKEALLEYFRFSDLYLVFGVSSDKNSKQMLSYIAPIAKKLIFTQAKSRRALPALKLVEQTRDLRIQKPYQVVPDVVSAVKYAINMANKNDLVCVTGSFYVVGEARNLFKDFI